MQTIFIKLIAISLWCGQPSYMRSDKPEVTSCRTQVYQCLQGKTTQLQLESCFMAAK